MESVFGGSGKSDRAVLYRRPRRGLGLADPARLVLRAAVIGIIDYRAGIRRRDLLDLRYSRGQSVEEIARRLCKAPNVVSASLYRLRKALLACIESRLAAD